MYQTTVFIEYLDVLCELHAGEQRAGGARFDQREARADAWESA
jgi:hypothetical protein